MTDCLSFSPVPPRNASAIHFRPTRFRALCCFAAPSRPARNSVVTPHTSSFPHHPHLPRSPSRAIDSEIHISRDPLPSAPLHLHSGEERICRAVCVSVVDCGLPDATGWQAHVDIDVNRPLPRRPREDKDRHDLILRATPTTRDLVSEALLLGRSYGFRL